MKRILWTENAKADLRRIDRHTAMRILYALTRLAAAGEGDVIKLQGESDELRLRVGDYRLRFIEETPETLLIKAVRHRSAAY